MKQRELVNLDAMIVREDFAAQGNADQIYELIQSISLRDFMPGALMGPNLRKPDFQRETNHWGPSQILSLLECFVNGDLIPSVILWKSPTNIFVVDGGHRLSILKAWVEDDYGDGPISVEYFDRKIPKNQSRVAEKTRKLINEKIGSFKHIQSRLAQPDIAIEEKKKLNSIISRALPIQWVNGDAERAEASFFKINTEGTPLDDIEELLLQTRKKPISIAARAIIRAGTGHKYWSGFKQGIVQQIEDKAQKIHSLLFEPEIFSPIKTLDLPLGGARGYRAALKVLLDFTLVACRNQQGEPVKVKDQEDDLDGNNTLTSLNDTVELIGRMTGNDRGSLGLHPAVYFYGPSGQHQAPMFMGAALLIKTKLLNNDSGFFKNFSECRAVFEEILIEHKTTIAAIIQASASKVRIEKYAQLLDKLIQYAKSNNTVTQEDIVSLGGLSGNVFVGKVVDSQAVAFNDDVKSETFIRKALKTAMKCSVCHGYLDPEKSMSYDHVKRVRDGGSGEGENCDLSHPYCNQSIKQ